MKSRIANSSEIQIRCKTIPSPLSSSSFHIFRPSFGPFFDRGDFEPWIRNRRRGSIPIPKELWPHFRNCVRCRVVGRGRDSPPHALCNRGNKGGTLPPRNPLTYVETQRRRHIRHGRVVTALSTRHQSKQTQSFLFESTQGLSLAVVLEQDNTKRRKFQISQNRLGKNLKIRTFLF
jgi:hypothetical protein